MPFNMDPKKCPMPSQEPNVRNKNFQEVALVFSFPPDAPDTLPCVSIFPADGRTRCHKPQRQPETVTGPPDWP